MTTLKIQFITPLFSRGAMEDVPEIRAPSIRGQLHWWFRALGGKPEDERKIFGSVHKNFGGQKNKPASSTIVVRVADVEGRTGNPNTLPHKSGAPAAPKAAFLPGASFTLHFLERGGGMDRTTRSKWEQTLRAWLLLGSLGLRSTRGAGSFYWQSDSPTYIYPANLQAYQRACQETLSTSLLRFAILNQAFKSAEDARRIVSDTLGGRDTNKRSENDDLRRLRNPLGSISPRKTSPLKFRIICISGNDNYIAAIWDARDHITGNRTSQDLPGVIKLLQEKKPALGNLLAQAVFTTG